MKQHYDADNSKRMLYIQLVLQRAHFLLSEKLTSILVHTCSVLTQFVEDKDINTIYFLQDRNIYSSLWKKNMTRWKYSRIYFKIFKYFFQNCHRSPTSRGQRLSQLLIPIGFPTMLLSTYFKPVSQSKILFQKIIEKRVKKPLKCIAQN